MRPRRLGANQAMEEAARILNEHKYTSRYVPVDVRRVLQFVVDQAAERLYGTGARATDSESGR